VPPHLKTQEFYEECAARLGERGVFITNLHPDTELYLADIKTLQSVFRQVALFRTANRGNVIALGVKYRSPAIDDPSNWTPTSRYAERFGSRLDLANIAREHVKIPAQVSRAKVLTDDFAPVEFLSTIELNNTGETR
jgi:spermidine synthase